MLIFISNATPSRDYLLIYLLCWTYIYIHTNIHTYTYMGWIFIPLLDFVLLFLTEILLIYLYGKTRAFYMARWRLLRWGLERRGPQRPRKVDLYTEEGRGNLPSTMGRTIL